MTHYLHQDHLGSTGLVTTASGAFASARFHAPFGAPWYTPTTAAAAPTLGTRFGEPWPVAGTQQPAPAATDRHYTGQRSFEASLGSLYHYQARWYSPVLGRFLSPDPIVPNPANPQAFNRYSYVYNNPLIYIDPTGLRNEYFRSTSGSGSIWYGTYRDGSWHGIRRVAAGDAVENIGGGLLVSCDGDSCTVWREHWSSRGGGSWSLTKKGPLDGIIAVGKKIIGLLIGAEEDAPHCYGPDTYSCNVYPPVGNMLMVGPGKGPPGGPPGRPRRPIPSVRGGKVKQTVGNATIIHLGDVVARRVTVNLKHTIKRILAGKKHPHRRDGTPYENRPHQETGAQLPVQGENYYTEYVHPSDDYGIQGAGPQRIVVGRGGEWYYTPDHYASFRPLN